MILSEADDFILLGWAMSMTPILTYLSNLTGVSTSWDFPDGPVVKNLPDKPGDAGSIPGQGTKIPHSGEQLSPHTPSIEPLSSRARAPPLGSLCSTTTEACELWNQRSSTTEPTSQLESPRATTKDPAWCKEGLMCHDPWEPSTYTNSK